MENQEKPEENGIYPLFGANGILGYSNSKIYDEGIIIGRVGAYCGSLFYSKEPFWGSDNTILVTDKNNKLPLEYAYFALESLNLRNYAGGAAQPLLTQSVITKLKILIPPKELLDKFVSIVSPMIQLVKQIEKKNSSLFEIRNLLLPKLISGEIDISDIDIQL